MTNHAAHHVPNGNPTAAMTEDQFWNLIALIDPNILDTPKRNQEATIQPLVDALATLPEPMIVSFQQHLEQRLADLGHRRYVRAAHAPFASSDAFLYTRCFIIALGRDAYRQTLSNPTLMPKSPNYWCEPLLSAARLARLARRQRPAAQAVRTLADRHLT